MKTHLMPESLLKKFVCNIIVNDAPCGKRFATPANLNAHVNVHKGIKKFECNQPECNAAYFQPKDLRHHKRNVHDKIKIKCELCSTLVTRKDYYVRHVKLGHQELDPEAKEKFINKIRKMKISELYVTQQ